MQNSGPWDLWLPVVENSQLFAQRAHSALCTVRPLGPLVPTLHLLQVLHYKENVINIAGCKRCVGTIE